MVTVNFSSSKSPQSTNSSIWNYLGKYYDNSSFGIKIKVFEVLPKVSYPNITIENSSGFDSLQITFDKIFDDIDGYKIYKADYNSTTQTCYYNYSDFATLVGKENNIYKVTIDSLLKSSDLARQIKAGNSYCFNIVSFKENNGFVSTSKLMDNVLAISIPKDTTTDTINLSDGLVAHYEFEGDANDSSGNGNHGTEHGGVSYVDGVIGQAGSFDGVDDYINISHNDSLVPKSYSVSVFYKSSAIDYQGEIVCNGIDKHYYQIQFNSRGDDEKNRILV